MAQDQEKEKRAEVAYYYDASKNPHGAAFPGVPLGNILQDTYDAQPAWIQRSIDVSPMYRKTPVPKSAPAEKPAPKKATAKKQKEEAAPAPAATPVVVKDVADEPVDNAHKAPVEVVDNAAAGADKSGKE